MQNRKRNRSVCLRLTDEELALWKQRCGESGMTQTDFMIAAITNTTLHIYRIEEGIQPLLFELRHIGGNLNQLAYQANCGNHNAVRCEIESMRKAHNRVMAEIFEFLSNPKFTEITDVR